MISDNIPHMLGDLRLMDSPYLTSHLKNNVKYAQM